MQYRSRLPLTSNITNRSQRTGLVIACRHRIALRDTESGEGFAAVARHKLKPVPGDIAACLPPQAPGGDYQITALQTRTTLLVRAMPGDKHRPVAANLDAAVIVTAPIPTLSLHAIDRALTLICASDITPVLVLNKSDLLAENAAELEVLREYADAGFETHLTSALCGDGLAALQHRLRGTRALLSGISGVGKSSLLNALAHKSLARTDTAPTSGKSGRHVTTETRLHMLGTFQLIDAPGIRQIETWHLSPEQIAKGFPDLSRHFSQCRFRNCRHGTEPDCALRRAAAEGMISPGRLDRYLQLLYQTPP